jgi:hypothetical protein
MIQVMRILLCVVSFLIVGLSTYAQNATNIDSNAAKQKVHFDSAERKTIAPTSTHGDKVKIAEQDSIQKFGEKRELKKGTKEGNEQESVKFLTPKRKFIAPETRQQENKKDKRR